MLMSTVVIIIFAVISVVCVAAGWIFSRGAYTASDERPVEKSRSGHARLELNIHGI